MLFVWVKKPGCYHLRFSTEPLRLHKINAWNLTVFGHYPVVKFSDTSSGHIWYRREVFFKPIAFIKFGRANR